MAKAFIARIADLETLALRLPALGAGVETAIDQVLRSSSACLSSLEERVHAISDELRGLERASDDDEGCCQDGSRCQEELEQELGRVRFAIESVQVAASLVREQAARFREEVAAQTGGARSFLLSKAELLQQYRGSTPRSSSPRSTSGPRSSPGLRAGTGALPRGFRWVRIEDIDPGELTSLPARGDFRKISYEQMSRGFDLLESEVLPALARSGGMLDIDALDRRDRELGRDASSSAGEVYRAFFGTFSGENIRLDRTGKGGTYRVGNGRHRLRVAIDRGWRVIPVWVEGESS